MEFVSIFGATLPPRIDNITRWLVILLVRAVDSVTSLRYRTNADEG